MTNLIEDHLRRDDLIHADQPLLPRASCDLPHAAVTMWIRDDEGLDFLFKSVLDPGLEPTTISMSLVPRDYHPEEFPEPEMPPSNLYFSVDPEHGVAAVALLAFDRDHESHQWLPRGDAWRPEAASLAMDHTIPYDTPFPSDAYITIAQSREVVVAWA